MFCDRLAASRVYMGENYTDRSPWEYYDKYKGHYIIHPETAGQLEAALRVLRDEGEDAAFAWVKKNLLGRK